jgi:hypothetical protein
MFEAPASTLRASAKSPLADCNIQGSSYLSRTLREPIGSQSDGYA